MRDWSLALLVGIGLVSGGMLTASQGAIAETMAASSGGSKAQCLHPQMGLTTCEVSLNADSNRLHIVWPDGESTDLDIGNDETQVRYTPNSEWQEAQYLGLCWDDQCFQARAKEISGLERGNERIAAQCFDPMNGTSACYVQASPETQQLTISWLNGHQSSVAYQPEQSLGLCVDNICAFNLQPQSGSSERFAQAGTP